MACVSPHYVSLRVSPETSGWITELSQHEADGGEAQEGERRTIEVLPVLGEPSAAVEPGESALDNPTLGQYAKSLGLIGPLTICVRRRGKVVFSASWNCRP